MQGTNTQILAGKWQLNKLEKLGPGKVYRGKNIATDELVAIKQLKVEPGDFEEVLNDIKTLKTFNEKNHPNVVRLLDQVTDGHSVYLVLEFCEGGNLRQKLVTSKYTEKEGLDLARKIAEGISTLHEVGIPHKSIKAENVLFKNGEPKISEFTVYTYETATSKYSMGDKPSEYYTGEELTVQFDIWGFGVLLHEILFGTHPCGDQVTALTLIQFATKENSYKLSDEDKAKISPLTTELLQKCLATKASKRITIADIKAHPCFTA